jgi:hypothetical protein
VQTPSTSSIDRGQHGSLVYSKFTGPPPLALALQTRGGKRRRTRGICATNSEGMHEWSNPNFAPRQGEAPSDPDEAEARPPSILQRQLGQSPGDRLMPGTTPRITSDVTSSAPLLRAPVEKMIPDGCHRPNRARRRRAVSGALDPGRSGLSLLRAARADLAISSRALPDP